MRYVNKTTNTVHYIVDIRRENPNVSIPDDADCSAFGYEFLIESTAPQKYGFQARELPPIDNVQQWGLVAIPLPDLKAEKKAEVKQAFTAEAESPIVDTGLGFSVDGGRDNKDDFFSKWEAMVDLDTTTVRDAYNSFHHGVTKAQMQVIYRAIVANGEALLGKKWALEAQIDAAVTIAELEAVKW